MNKLKTPHALFRLCIVLGLLAATVVNGQGDPPRKMEDQIRDANQRLAQILYTKDFQEELPFSKFLDLLGKRLSEPKKFTIRLDREAFGKNADKILQGMVVLPPVPSRMAANTALRLTLAQTPGSDAYEIEFLPGQDGLLITTRDHSLYPATYDIRDLLKEIPSLHESFARMAKLRGPDSIFAHFDLKADPKKPDEWAVRQIIALTSARAGWRNPKRPSTIQILNGARLVIHAPPSVHEEISSTLQTFRVLTDLAVVMNARLLEMDRAAYERDVAPMFIDGKDKKPRQAVAKISPALAEKLKKQNLVLEADAVKIRPYQEKEFLSLRTAHPYLARPGNAFETIHDGITFNVTPIVSPDRRCLRLTLSQQTVQLVKFTKGTVVDLKTGKDVVIDLPNVKKSTSSAMIEIPELQAIVAAVDYRPAAKDRVWLLLAEPMIYMEAEQERLRRDAIKPMLGADEKPAPVEPEPPMDDPKAPPRAAVELPDNDDVKAILQAVVENVLTDPQLKNERVFYGTAAEKKFALDFDADHFLWPRKFKPSVAGFTMHAMEPGECRGFRTRLMGIRLELFGWDPKKPAPKEVDVVVALHNVGGSVNGAVIGGCHISYVVEREGKRWVAHWTLIECH